MRRLIPASCQVVIVCLTSVAAVAAPGGPIKATKPVSAFAVPPNQLNSLVVAGDGNAYGATNQGHLVRVTPNGAFSVVHNFLGEAVTTPTALTLGKDGNLYGILSSNGSIFKSDLAGNVTILATLGSAAKLATVFQAGDGNLYGTTTAGGSANQGSIFKLNPAGELTTVYSFAGDTAGYAPTELIETTPGVFYGVCLASSYGSKAIFRLNADGTLAIVHDFYGTNDHDPANLVLAGDGNVYGSYTHYDGYQTRYSLFRLTPPDELTPFSDFGGYNEIGYGDVVLGADGNLYATTRPYGQPAGKIARITLGGQVTILHNFSGSDDGSDPGILAPGPNQVLYGLASSGSVAYRGTVYRIDSGGQFATLLSLGTLGEGYSPNGAFFQADDGGFYGATVAGGSGGFGTVYRVTPSGERTTVHEFGADTGAPNLLVMGKDGKLYGACSGPAWDSVFRLDVSGAFTLLHQFSGGDGAHVTGLVASPNGNIYGVTNSPYSSSNPSYGSFFRVTPAGAFTVIKMFDQSLGNPARFVGTKDGKLYGIGSGSGSNGPVLFRIATDGATVVVHYFSGDQIVGNPNALIAGADGNLYGTLSGLTVYAHGVLHIVGNGGLWRCSSTGDFAILHTFDNRDGLFFPSLVAPTANGDLYGLVGGSVIYRNTAAGVFEPLYKCDHGVLGLILGQDGNLYGTAGNEYGLSTTTGPLGGGMLFKFLFGQPSAVNLATRMKVGTGDNVSIGGFIVTGNAPKKVLLRGIGPSLAVNGQPLGGKLDDPVLELHDANGTIIGRNDNWRTSQPGGVVNGDQSAQIRASGLAPTDDREAVLIASLQPGRYTAIVSGSNNATGIGLVEIYDLDIEADAQLANISTRGFAGAGDNALIGGFIVDGSSYSRSKVVVRAIGPTLAQFGLTNLLQNPSLAIYDRNGNQQGANDDWRDGNQPEIVSLGLTPQDDRESALHLTLSAGNYTAIVSGKDGATGVALVETYNVP